MRYRATAKKLTARTHDGVCLCVPGTRQAETHATISYSHRAVSLLSVLRRRNDKGAGNSLFMPGTMSAHRRLGLIPNETSLSTAGKTIRHSRIPSRAFQR